MPRVTLTESQKFENLCKENMQICKNMYTAKGLAKIMGVSIGTARTRLKSPDTLTLGELRLLCKRVGIEPRDFIGGRISLYCDVKEEKP